MYLLTWHGTLLRVETATQRLIQAPLIPQRPSARDFAIPATAVAEAGTLMLAASNGVRLRPGPDAGTRCITIGQFYASASPGGSEVRANRTEPEQDCIFLVISPELLAGVRRLLRGVWRAGDRELGVGEIALLPGYRLALGAWQLDLARATVLELGGGEVFVEHDGSRLTLRLVAEAAAAGEVFLRPFSEADRPALAADDAEFLTLPQASLRLPGARELCTPPLTQALAERDWLYERALDGRALASGWQRRVAVLTQLRDGYVVLASPAEGLCFAADGGTEGGARLAALAGSALDWIGTEGGSVFAARELLEAAPAVTGTVVVPYTRGPVSAGAVLADLLPRLLLAAPILPADTALLLPAHAAAETEALLARFGLGAIACRRDCAPVCRVARVITLAPQPTGDLPATAFRALRARLDPAEGEATRRIYLRGGAMGDAKGQTAGGDHHHAAGGDKDNAASGDASGGRQHSAGAQVHNPGPVEAVARNQGFELIDPAALDLDEMITAMRQAAFVIGASGDALGWTVLCSAGTKVIELAPRAGFDPAQSEISSKLELVHLVLSCSGKAGRMVVSPRRLRAAIWMLGARQ